MRRCKKPKPSRDKAVRLLKGLRSGQSVYVNSSMRHQCYHAALVLGVSISTRAVMLDGTKVYQVSRLGKGGRRTG
jgi:hypothetical protein